MVALKANIHKLAGRREDAFRVYTQKWRGARIFLRGHGNIHKLTGRRGDAFRIYTQKWRGARIFLRGRGNLRGGGALSAKIKEKKKRIYVRKIKKKRGFSQGHVYFDFHFQWGVLLEACEATWV